MNLIDDSATTVSNGDDDLSIQQTLQQQFCSFAALGPIETFQAIYVCLTCQQQHQQQYGMASSWCVCSACAESCHETHDVEYLGMGLSYCDCMAAMPCCRIAAASFAEAQRLGLTPHDCTPRGDALTLYNCPAPKFIQVESPVAAASTVESITRVSSSPKGSYIRDVWEMDLLHDASISELLARQAQALVQHSRDTFWLDEATVKEAVAEPTKNVNTGTHALCALEVLAWTIFRHHVQHYCSGGNATPVTSENTNRGVEWWVQVKPVTPPPLTAADTVDETENSNGAEAVDLHYDKDEALAESFGVGVFPALSTVTYLTDSRDAPPTLIFARRYDEGDNDREPAAMMINDVMLCRPQRAKHVVFDGRLLHGAPSHFALRPTHIDTATDATPTLDTSTTAATTMTPSLRITFLVNLWLDHKPANVQVLPQFIRGAIALMVPTDALLKSTNGSFPIAWSSLSVTELNVTEEIKLNGRRPIELPFVGGKSTWAENKDTDDGSNGSEDDRANDSQQDDIVVLVMYPPPHHKSDTVLIRFGPGMQAYLQHYGSDDDTSRGSGENTEDEETYMDGPA